MGLIIEDLQEGSGKTAEKGKRITVHYTGYLTDGRKFDSSLDRGTPFTLVLGAGQVIQGWDEGFGGMKEGGKRKLTIPPEMGYGARGAGGVIPPSSKKQPENLYFGFQAAFYASERVSRAPARRWD